MRKRVVTLVIGTALLPLAPACGGEDWDIDQLAQNSLEVVDDG